MSKFFLGILGVCSIVFLSGCSSTPEQVYMEALDGEMSRLEAIGESLNNLGDQLLDENFNQAFTTLTLLQDDLDALVLPTYVGTDASLEKAAEELKNAMEQTANLTDVLQPVLQKAAENDGYTASTEDLAALTTAEELTTKIDMHMSAASEVLDAYSAK